MVLCSILYKLVIVVYVALVGEFSYQISCNICVTESASME